MLAQWQGTFIVISATCTCWPTKYTNINTNLLHEVFYLFIITSMCLSLSSSPTSGSWRFFSMCATCFEKKTRAPCRWLRTEAETCRSTNLYMKALRNRLVLITVCVRQMHGKCTVLTHCMLNMESINWSKRCNQKWSTNFMWELLLCFIVTFFEVITQSGRTHICDAVLMFPELLKLVRFYHSEWDHITMHKYRPCKACLL